jgi:hypothetical protein
MGGTVQELRYYLPWLVIFFPIVVIILMKLCVLFLDRGYLLYKWSRKGLRVIGENVFWCFPPKLPKKYYQFNRYIILPDGTVDTTCSEEVLAVFNEGLHRCVTHQIYTIHIDGEWVSSINTTKNEQNDFTSLGWYWKSRGANDLQKLITGLPGEGNIAIYDGDKIALYKAKFKEECIRGRVRHLFIERLEHESGYSHIVTRKMVF